MKRVASVAERDMVVRIGEDAGTGSGYLLLWRNCLSSECRSGWGRMDVPNRYIKTFSVVDPRKKSSTRR